MKHFLHLISAAGLLLGALIILNVQKPEEASRPVPVLEMGSLQLLADIPGDQGAVSCVSGLHRLETSFESISGELKHRAFLYRQAQVIRSKSQLQIHLEMKPLLLVRSVPFLSMADRYDDPPHC